MCDEYAFPTCYACGSEYVGDCGVCGVCGADIDQNGNMRLDDDSDDYESDYYDPDYADYGGMPDDEWDDDDGPDETSYHTYLLKAKNGHIAIVQGVLGRYPGEDWGEASYWEESTLNISHLIDEQRLAIVAYAKDLEPGQHDFSFGWLDEDEEDDEMPTPPTSVDEIPF